MADPLYFLNKDDRDHLQQMLTWFKQRRTNLQSRSPLDLPGRSSDTYIAVVPDIGGIPPLTTPGTGTGTGFFDPDTNRDNPGFAECDIFQVVDIGDGFPTIEPLGFSLTVYNLSRSVIGRDWILVTRDKFGTWVAISGGGGTCESQNAKMMFTIIGKPTGGTFSFNLSINASPEVITVNWNSSASAFATTLAGHSQLSTTDIDVTEGPLPNTSMIVEFIGTQANTNIQIPSAAWGSLTGGSGVAVIISLIQLGHE